MRTIHIDGKYINVSAGLLNVFRPGVFKAKGVFETMLGIDGRIMDLEAHIKRLKDGLKVLGIKSMPIDPTVLKKVLRCNQLSTARLRLMVWQENKTIHVMATALPYQIPGQKSYRVCLFKTNRPANARYSTVKSLDYGLFANAYAKAQEKGFDEAILLNAQGHIFEASRANIFWMNSKVLYTPPLSSGCLNGITRQQVIKEAQRLLVVVKEKNLTPAILRNADAAFLTNSLIGIKSIEIPSGAFKEIVA